MERKTLYKLLVVVGVILISLYLVYPWHEKIKLGLDLRGGMHLILEVDTNDTIRNEVFQMKDRIKRNLGTKKIEIAKSYVTDDNSLYIEIGEGIEPERVKNIIENDFTNFNYIMNYEDNPRVFLLTLVPDIINKIKDSSVNQALETIRGRIDELGVSEPTIQREGLSGQRILVQLPGVEDVSRAKRIIGRTAFLEWREVSKFAKTKEELIKELPDGQLPEHQEILPILEKRGLEKDVTGYYLLMKESVISGADLQDARLGYDNSNLPAVNFTLTPDGGKRFYNFTGENIGKQLAIVLDKIVQSAPVVKDKIRERGIISGSYTVQDAEDLALVLRAGALPASIKFLEERTVGPSLGQDSIQMGLKAGIYGSVLVVIFMLIYYGSMGLIAVLALSLNMLFIFAGLSLLGAVLTLPGIAGIVLTIGMAVDANILIFERIREEKGKTILIKHGQIEKRKPFKSAVTDGFARATVTIWDANLTTLIAAIILFAFGTGPIKGFAITLSIGIAFNIFTACFVSRMIFDLILEKFIPQKPMRLQPESV